MKLLLRYQLREILVPLAAWVSFLCLLLFVMSFLRGTDVLLGSGVTAKDLGLLVLYLAPHFVQQALPIAFLLAILLGIGRLAEDLEVSAMQALGVGPLRLLAGPLFTGAVLGAVVLLLSSTLEPWGLRSVEGAANEVIKKNLAGDVKPGVFYEDLTNLTVYAEKVDPKARRWTNVLVHDHRDEANPMLVLARGGQVNASGAGEALKLGLSEGAVHRSEREKAEYTVVDYDTGEIVIGVGESFYRKNKFRSPKEQLTPGELLQAADEARARGEAPEPLLMTFHWRMGQAFMPLAFALLGTPLAMGRRGAGRAKGYVLTIGGYVLYFVLSRVFVALGEQGRLAPLIAGQLPNVIFVVLGVFAMVRVSRAGAAR
ncbi:MAG: LptF/LptG family permease [Myxococcaceae bacterium]